MVRKYLEREIPRQYAYIITGTHGTKLTMNEDSDEKKSVRMPASYWKAFCHDDGNRVYAWVYSQINENDQTQSQGLSGSKGPLKFHGLTASSCLLHQHSGTISSLT